VAHRADAGVEVECLPQGDVERAETATDWRGQRPFDGNAQLAQRGELIEHWRERKITGSLAEAEPALQCHLGKSFADALHDPLISLELICRCDPESTRYSDAIKTAAELEIRYEHYIIAQDKRIDKMKKMETSRIPANFNYDAVSGLSTESLARLKKVMPATIGQASRIPGIRPSDIMVLMVAIK